MDIFGENVPQVAGIIGAVAILICLICGGSVVVSIVANVCFYGFGAYILYLAHDAFCRYYQLPSRSKSE